MADIAITWADVEGLKAFEAGMRSLQSQFEFSNVARRAINRTGEMARTQVVKTLAAQTGLTQKVVRMAVKPKRANYDSLAYTMTSTGGEVRLKYFKPRETRKGVTAAPFGKRQLFPGTFMKGGLFPGRVAIARFAGNVFERDGSSKFPVAVVKSKVIIPAEMVDGATAAAFRSTVAEQLPRRFAHELRRATGVAFT